MKHASRKIPEILQRTGKFEKMIEDRSGREKQTEEEN